MRSIAILLVLVHHAGIYMPSEFYINNVHPFIFADGVDIFFVLSGFLIGQIIIRTFSQEKIQKKDLLHFWTNRWFRTLPLYFFILLILVIWGDTSNDNGRLWMHFIFLQNFFWTCSGFFGETWSLAIEEWFYFFIPLMIFLFKKGGIPINKSIPYVILIVILGALACRIYNYTKIDPNDFSYYFFDKAIRKQVLTRLDSILLGVLGAYLFTHKKEIWLRHKNALLLSGIALVLSLHLLSLYLFDHYSPAGAIYLTTFSVFANCVPFLLMLPFFHSLKTGKGIIYKIITYISIISYSLYLVNLTPVTEVINALRTSFNTTQPIELCLYLVLTFAISTVTYKLIEQPSLKLRGKFNKRFFGKK